MNENQTIIGSEWFTEYGATNIIGIVLIHDKFDGLKAYIGVGKGNNQRTDEIKIAERGAKFPIEMAKELIGYKNK